MVTKTRYIRKSAVLPKTGGREKFDSIAERRKRDKDIRTDADLLNRFETAWRNDENVRNEGERCHRYVYGDQWGDMVWYDGKWMTERQYIIQRGKVPLTMNLLRRMVTSVEGSYLKQKSEPRCIPYGNDSIEAAEMLSKTLTTNWRRNYNSMYKQCATALENFLIRGIAVMGESYERTANGKYDAVTRLYDVRKVAVESPMNDPLMNDVSMVGIIHDVHPHKFLAKFGTRISKATMEKVKEEYGKIREYSWRSGEIDNADRNRLENLDFRNNNDPALWRFYEIWTLEIKTMILCVDPAQPVDPFKVENVDKFRLEMYDGLTVKEENERRRKEAKELGIPDDEVPYIDYGQYGDESEFEGTGEMVDEYWYVKYLTPNATIIDEYVSPYECGCPITIAKYPYVNGEVHSYINDGLEMQRFFNRMWVLNDAAIRSTAKGALLMDTRAIGDDQTPEEIKENWGDPDGVVFYDSKRGGQLPRQVSNTSTNVGIDQSLSMTIKVMEDSLGNHGAAQGKDALSGQSGSLYAQQAANSEKMLLPVLEAFRDFTKTVAYKKLSIINQYYENGRPINTYGSDLQTSRYERSLVDDLDYEITIINADDMETAAAVNNEVTMNIFAKGAEYARAILNTGTWDPQYKARALKAIDEQEAAMAQRQADAQQLAALQEGLPQQQAQQTANGLYNGNLQIA